MSEPIRLDSVEQALADNAAGVLVQQRDEE